MREHGGLHAYSNRREATPSTAASGPGKPSDSGQGPSWRDFGVRYGVATDGALDGEAEVAIVGTWILEEREAEVRLMT